MAAYPGVVARSGNYTQTSSNTLEIELGGANPGTDYDRLAVTGSADFDVGAVLDVTLINLFIPSSGAMFDVLTRSSGAGVFVENLSSMSWVVSYNTNEVQLTTP